MSAKKYRCGNCLFCIVSYSTISKLGEAFLNLYDFNPFMTFHFKFSANRLPMLVLSPLHFVYHSFIFLEALTRLAMYALIIRDLWVFKCFTQISVLFKCHSFNLEIGQYSFILKDIWNYHFL